MNEAISVNEITLYSTVTVYTPQKGSITSEDLSNLIDWGGFWLSSVGVMLTAVVIIGGFLSWFFYKDYRSFQEDVKSRIEKDTNLAVKRELAEQKQEKGESHA